MILKMKSVLISSYFSSGQPFKVALTVDESDKIVAESGRLSPYVPTEK